MILKALYDYYQRKLKLGEIPPLGFEDKAIQFVVVIDKNGKLLALEDQRTAENPKGRVFRIPKSVDKSSNIQANLLWGKSDYIFGYVDEDAILKKIEKENKDETPQEIEEKVAKEIKKAKERSPKLVKAFLDRIDNLIAKYPENIEFSLVKKFLELPDNFDDINHTKEWTECKNKGSCNITFRIVNNAELVSSFSNKDLFNYIQNDILPKEEERQDYVCLISGKKTTPIRTHSKVPSGKMTSLVSFQVDSGFDSYYKERGYNAPVSKEAELSYVAALNSLYNSPYNKVTIKDCDILFWSDSSNSEVANSFCTLFGMTSSDNPDAFIVSLQKLINSVETGKCLIPEDHRFYALGLEEANQSRLLVRFFVNDTERVIGKHIVEHFSDFDIIENSKTKILFSLGNILLAVAQGNKSKYIPSNIEGALVSAILSGGMYPRSLQLQCINRTRVDRKRPKTKKEKFETEKFERIRAAILKAYLNRKNRILNNKEREIKVSLDIENNDVGYLCGRLFAVFENIQLTALGKDISSTITDRYYGAASTTPVVVFARLISLSNHHLSKIKTEKPLLVKGIEDLKSEIIGKISPNGLPSHFSLDEQSRFAIGYYHQKQIPFKSKEKIETLENEDNND